MIFLISLRGHPEGECIVLIRGITERLGWYENGTRVRWVEDDFDEEKDGYTYINEWGEEVERERNQPDIIAREYLLPFTRFKKK